MKRSSRVAFFALFLGALMILVFMIRQRYTSAIAEAEARVAQGSAVVSTLCGAIEYQEAGTGSPLLMIHGSGGGYDQGMVFAGPLTHRGIRVIAMSRFGYLRTAMPVDASPAAQADAYACLLDALGVHRASILGASAGAPSASAAAAGLFWAAMPCGLLQSALLGSALASGLAQGAAVMGTFAISSAIGLHAAPIWWKRLRALRSSRWQSLPVRAAGLLLVGASTWALGRDAGVRAGLAWCA